LSSICRRHQTVPPHNQRNEAIVDFDDLSQEDFNDPDVEEAWIRHMRATAIDYLRSENVYYRKLDDKPAWHIAPITTIWAVESTNEPGYIGWWAFCGDHPSDYISSAQAQSPRDALKVLCEEWQGLCRSLRQGREHPTRAVGPRETWPQILEVLEPRAATLLAFTKDRSLWK